LTISAGIKHAPGNTNAISLNTGVLTLSVTMTGTDFTTGTQQVGTSEEALDFVADIGTPGYLLIRNLDSTNFISFDAETATNYTMKLLAGEFALLRLGHTVLLAKADTAACQIQYWLFEA
jgi:hypothetical protein